ncbi:uncharacterized protein LOC144926433 [Branchiostoma floridae x Branchiostoma belcheri]
MPPNIFFVQEEVQKMLTCMSQENGAFAFSADILKANESLLESVKTLQKSDAQCEVPIDLQYLIGDFEIDILKSSIDIGAKVEKLIICWNALRQAVDDNTRPLKEFLENINLSKYAQALSDYETVEDFIYDTTPEKVKAELEKLLQEAAPPVHRRKLARELEKCRGKKKGIPKIVGDMDETLREILEFSKKMADAFPEARKKIRNAIDSIKKNKAKYQGDHKWYTRAKWICGGLGVLAAAVTCGAAIYVGIGVKVAAAGLTAAGAAGGYSYYSHTKTRELEDYLQELEKMEKAMGDIHKHIMKREVNWINLALGPAKKADATKMAEDRVINLPSTKQSKEDFRKEVETALKTLLKFGEGMTNLQDTANSVLSVLNG